MPPRLWEKKGSNNTEKNYCLTVNPAHVKHNFTDTRSVAAPLNSWTHTVILTVSFTADKIRVNQWENNPNFLASLPYSS